MYTGTKHELSNLMTCSSASGPARMANAVPQQRPNAMWPLCVNRNTRPAVLLRQLLSSEYLREPADLVEVLFGRGRQNSGNMFVEPLGDVGVGLGRLGQSWQRRQEKSRRARTRGVRNNGMKCSRNGSDLGVGGNYTAYRWDRHHGARIGLSVANGSSS